MHQDKPRETQVYLYAAEEQRGDRIVPLCLPLRLELENRFRTEGNEGVPLQ